MLSDGAGVSGFLLFVRRANLRLFSGSLEVAPRSLAQIPKSYNLLRMQSVQKGRGGTAGAAWEMWSKALCGTAAPVPVPSPPAPAVPAPAQHPGCQLHCPVNYTLFVRYENQLPVRTARIPPNSYSQNLGHIIHESLR